MIKHIFKFIIFLLFLHTSLFACRYTVREIGFADYGADSYHFYLFKDNRISEEDAAAFKKISYAALLDANISAQIININAHDSLSVAVLQFYKKGDRNIVPSAVLVSPDGRAKPFYFSDKKEDFRESLWSALEDIVTSPARDELLQKIVKSYGVVLLIEGADASQTNQARKKVEKAIEKIKMIMADLPKPVDHPPELIEVKKMALKENRFCCGVLAGRQVTKANRLLP